MVDTLAVMPPRKPKLSTAATPPTDEVGAKTDTIRVDSDLAEMATIIAIRRKLSVSKLVSPALRAFIEAEYEKEVRAMHQRLPGHK